MGGPIFDRQVFVKQKKPQPSPVRSRLPGALALLLVAALSALATYRFVKAGGAAPSNGADQAQIRDLQAKLKTAQTRLDVLEKRRRPAPSKQVADEVQPGNSRAHKMLLAEGAAHSTGRVAGDEHHPKDHAAGNGQHSAGSVVAPDALPKVPPMAQQPAPVSKTLLAGPKPASDKDLSLLQSNLAANHEEWQATVDRLGNVVGQLDSQQTAIQKNQNNVNYLLERVQRSDVSFTLKKGSGLERVGPISMKLASTSVKNQHYSIRMMVDDKYVELKDRALNEIVQFYTSRSQYPLRLIVSRIERGQVSGTLAVPNGLGQEATNPQLQER